MAKRTVAATLCFQLQKMFLAAMWHNILCMSSGTCTHFQI
jgi:hypothetical protein